MKRPRPGSLELRLADLLQYGCYLASIVIVAGLWAARRDWVTLGIGLFVVLPVLRVLAMLAAFVHQKDYRFSGIAAAVLAIIFSGYALGLYLGHAPQ